VNFNLLQVGLCKNDFIERLPMTRREIV